MAEGQLHRPRYRRRRHNSSPSLLSPGGCLVVVLVLLVGLVLALLPAGVDAARHDPAAAREEAFIGWQGESYRGPNDGANADADAANAAAAGGGAADDADGGHAPGEAPAPRAAATPARASLAAADGAASPAPPTHVEVLSWKPRAFLFRNFLNASEARHFQRTAARLLRHSTVVGDKGQSVLRGDYRTSYGCFIRRRADPVMAEVSRRASAFVGIPELYAEDMQVLRYSKGQQYRAHMDSLRDDKAGPRVATLLLYFNDVPRGGETAFPDSSAWASPGAERRYGRDPLLSSCARGHVAARPKKGDALLFWSVKPDGETEDRASMHAGCPVEEGVKWTGTIWFHARPFREEWFNMTRDPADTADPGDCDDLHAQCPTWARSGECDRNPQYMRGDSGHLGRCRASCKACEQCGPRPDAAAAGAAAVDAYKSCRALNRHRAGYLVYDQDFEDPDEGVAAGEEALRRAGVALEDEGGGAPAA